MGSYWALSNGTFRSKRLVVEKLIRFKNYLVSVVPPRGPYWTQIAYIWTEHYILLHLPVHQIWCQSERNCDLNRVYTHIHMHTQTNTHTHTYKQRKSFQARDRWRIKTQHSGTQKLVFEDMICFSPTS